MNPASFEIVIAFDPRELWFVASFSDCQTEWSYSHDSALEALENFLERNGTLFGIEKEPRVRLAGVKSLVVAVDGKSRWSLKKSAAELDSTILKLLESRLKVVVSEVFVVEGGLPRVPLKE